MSLPVRQSPRMTRSVKTEASVPKIKEEPKTEKRSAIKDALANMKALPPKKPAKAVDAKAELKEEEETKPAALPKAKAAKAAPKAAPKTKKAKAGDDAPFADRTDVTALKKAMYIGAHVSSAGGVQNAVSNSARIGGNAFALFLKPHRKWASPPMADDARDAFVAACKEHGYDAGKHCLPHGSYLVNLAQPDKAKNDQAYSNFVDDLRRCDALGIMLYNFHPGAAVAGSGSRALALGRIADGLNRAHRDTAPSKVVTVIENMAGGGTTVGNTFEDLAAIIDLIDDKERVGVCIDTCHAFAAGYDLRTPEAFDKVVAEFDAVVGLQYLRAVHLNDSKAPFDSRRDVHANIGTGFLGLRAFHSLVNCDAFADMPIVLETPIERTGPDGKEFEDKQVWADEIKLLESLIGMDADSDAFKAKEKELQEEGTKSRKRLQDQVDKRAAKDVKKQKK